MAESTSATAQTGKFSEKEAAPAAAPETKPKIEDDEEEDEDIDALIEDLESQDGHGMDDEDEEVTPGGESYDAILPGRPRADY
jgi:H+-transporting ATPase